MEWRNLIPCDGSLAILSSTLKMSFPTVCDMPILGSKAGMLDSAIYTNNDNEDCIR